MAKELGVPVIALSQLNREVDKRPDKTPHLSDLRESGSLEQDADIVMFVNRLEQYGIENYEDGSTTKDTAQIIIAKNREGEIGTVKLAWNKYCTKFSNYETWRHSNV
jgi:replicative DNA helicase